MRLLDLITSKTARLAEIVYIRSREAFNVSSCNSEIVEVVASHC